MCTDGCGHSGRSMERRIEIAKLCGARVIGIHVVPDYRMMMAFADEVYPDPVAQEKVEEDARSRAQSFLAFVRRTAEKAGVDCETIVATNDHPYDAIVNAANEHGCD